MYNLLEYSLNYPDTSGSFWFHSKYEAITFDAFITKGNNFKYFEYKSKLLGNTVVDGNNTILKNVAIVI